MKNAGVGVGIPDTGRVKLVFEKDKKLHIYSGASCIGQGLGTVLTQMVVTNTDLKHEDIVYERSNTWFAPDSGTTSGSRQTLVTGEACRRACDKVMEDRNAGKTIDDVIGKIYYGEYLAKTDPLGANVPNPVSHVATAMRRRCVSWIRKQVRLRKWLLLMMWAKQSIHCPVKARSRAA